MPIWRNGGADKIEALTNDIAEKTKRAQELEAQLTEANEKTESAVAKVEALTNDIAEKTKRAQELEAQLAEANTNAESTA